MEDLDEPPRPKFVEKLHAKREQHLQRSKLIRGLYVVGGFTILLAGIVMLVTPGPAFVVIPIGLAILALEFAWAEAMLERAIREGEKAKRTGGRHDRDAAAADAGRRDAGRRRLHRLGRDLRHPAAPRLT